jgi:hypothetical protein
MPQPRSPLQHAASRANGATSRGPVTGAGKARAAANGTRHGLRGGDFALLPSEDADELASLRRAVAADWAPRDAYERHWAEELVAAMWRQRRLRGLELAALDAAAAEAPPSEVSLRRLLTFARYGARIDGDIGRALRTLRSLRDRPDDKIAEQLARTPEPEPAPAAAPAPEAAATRTSEPDIPTPGTAPPAPPPLNRHLRRRLEAMQRQERRHAA